MNYNGFSSYFEESINFLEVFRSYERSAWNSHPGIYSYVFSGMAYSIDFVVFH